MAQQVSRRTRFYRDKRRGKVMGVCAGIADYTGVDVTLVRIMWVATVLITGFTLPLYFITGWISPDTPSDMRGDDLDEQRFWQGVRASPAQSAREIRSRMRDVDRRLADIEYYVTTENRSLANEIEQLR